MRVCLTKVGNNNVSLGNEYNLSICADGCIGRGIRRDLPRCICGDGIKINIIVKTCDGILPAPIIQCNEMFKISSPIKLIRKNPCCGDLGINNDANDCCLDFDGFDIDGLDINSYDFSLDGKSSNRCNNTDKLPNEYAIVIRSYNPVISEFLCQYPQMYLEDCERTVKLTIIFDKWNSVDPCEAVCCCCC